MSTNLSQINTLINDRRRDTGTGSIDMSTVGFRAINSTLQIWNEVHDWPWTIKEQIFDYNPGIYDYALDSFAPDFKFPLTLKNYKPNFKTEEFWMVSPLRFDSAYLWSRRFAVNIAGQTQTLRVKTVDGNSASLSTATSYNENGTWIGTNAITNVGTNNYEGFDWPSSVSFNFNGTTGNLANSTIQALDFAQFQNRSNLYIDLFPPTVTNLQSVTLRWGSSATDYWHVTVTTDFLGQPFFAQWMKLKFAWDNPSSVGSPDVTNIGYCEIVITYSAPTNAGEFFFQNVFVSENVPLVLTYYSVNMVETLLGVQSQGFTSAAATTDTPLWTGRWDMATEPFINSVLEIIFWMTGEYKDKELSRDRILEIVTPLKARYPSQRRYPTMQVIPDINQQGGQNWPNQGQSWTW